jgi:hypothetical protein
MCHAPVDEMDFLDSFANCRLAAFDFRKHAAGYDAFFPQLRRIAQVQG